MSYRSPTARHYSESSVPGSASSVASGSVVSVSSTYRHHNSPFMPQTPTTPKPVLMTDAQHKPKTIGSVGLMVVGLGGANGTTLLAGVLANRLKIQWRGPKGEPNSPNFYGCITQLNQRGVYGGVGYKDKVKGLADATMIAVGGWDIRPDKPGDALLKAQILDYDLVRQVKEEMNKVKIFRGAYDARFIGESQHKGATYVLSKSEAPTDSEVLKCLRADIRYFKWRNGVVGHTTVIWSASVEPNCGLVEHYKTANELLEAIEMSEERRGGPLPPSLLYATAALLEGCSFVNGGSQNTVSCPGLNELAQRQFGVYCLGTDFKAGQTKFKTAAVEYIRTMGMKPKVIASSNHLGNNDMRNLATAKSASQAKLRVKHDIFSAWQEDDLDHKVSIMFTPYINDEKRDFVEYTSLGFMGQVHTMVTYTRASDSVLCVPLMVDAAIWCDYFSNVSWPYDRVAKALAYLFKVPEGAAKGVDPGFFRQMEELDAQAMAVYDIKSGKRRDSLVKKRVRIRPEEKSTEWAIPHDARIICAGLACVDMQLNQATGFGGEGIETFAGERSIGGGSVSMACKTLARLAHGKELKDSYMQVTPPVVYSVIPLCKVGNDDTGNKLINLLEKTGGACRNVVTKYVKNARRHDPHARTALSVLPIYTDGRRGCFFDAASNTSFSVKEMKDMLHNLCLSTCTNGPPLDTSEMSPDDFENYKERLDSMTPSYGAFLFGYPHLLPQLQGENLAEILLEAKSTMVEGGIVVVDLNGVPEKTFQKKGGMRTLVDLKNDPVIGAALEHIDILHMNEDELVLLTGCEIEGTKRSELDDEFNIAAAINLFLLSGVAVVAVTRGMKGSFVACNDAERFKRSPMLPSCWIDCTAKVRAAELPPNTVINSNGAGDSYTSGLLVAAMLRHTGMTLPSKPEDHNAMDESESSIDMGDISGPTRPPPQSKSKLTPYTLYMRENYVSLKQQCKDDKKAIFSKCHEMWENESEEVKAMYERKAAEEAAEEDDPNDMSITVFDDIEALDSTPRNDGNSSAPHFSFDEEALPRNMYMTNKALNLESAVHFASLIAAHHVDVGTRDLQHVDLGPLLERALVFSSGGLQEI